MKKTSNDKQRILDDSISSELKKILTDGLLGIEKESLRIEGKRIATTNHPKNLGSSLTNKFITN